MHRTELTGGTDGGNDRREENRTQTGRVTASDAYDATSLPTAEVHATIVERQKRK